MFKNIILIIAIASSPVCAAIFYYVTSLFNFIQILQIKIIALEKKCALLELAKTSAEKSTRVVDNQMKINEITNASSSPNNYLIISGFFVIACFIAYFSISNACLAKSLAKMSAEHQTQNAIKVSELITKNVVSSLSEEGSIIRTCLSNNENKLGAISNLFSNGIENNLSVLSSRLDTVSLKSEKILKMLGNKSNIATPNLSEVGIGNDLLSCISTIN
jgi:hypothetical protein